MDVTMPDGTVIRDVPEGTSKEEVMRKYKRKEKFLKTPQFEKDAQAIKNTSAIDLITGSAPGRFVSGVSDVGVGGLQLAAHALPFDAPQNYMDRVVREREESTRRGDLAYGREGFDWMRLMGNVMNPVGLKAAKVMPSGAAGKIGMGGLLGAGFGAASPVEDTSDYAGTKTTQTLIGGGLGLAIPAAIEGGKFGSKVIKHVLEPLTKSGQRTIRAREYLEAAGDKADDVVRLLERNKQLVPGSRPTAAEAAAPAGRAEFAAMQKAASAHRPSEYLARAKEQDVARLNYIKTISGTLDDLDNAIKARDMNGAMAYGQAFAKQINADPELAQISASPYFRGAVRDALKIAKTDKIDPKTQQVQFLHLVKRGLDKQLSKSNLKNPLGAEEKRAVTGLKDRLVGWIEKKVPDYRAARIQYADDSAPINRMMVGRELEKTLTQPISDIGEVGSQRIGPFAATMRDATSVIKKANQDPRFGELKDILLPKEMNRVQRVAQDLARRAQYEEQARAGIKSAKGNIVAAQLERETGGSTAPNALHRPIMILNAMLKRIQGRAGEKVEQDIALEMLNPKDVAAVMKKAMVSQKRIDAFLLKLEQLTGRPVGTNPIGYPSVIGGAALEGGRDSDATLNEIRNLMTP